jgi:3-oxoacyl-[acyl-carrier-protein] synthase II
MNKKKIAITGLGIFCAAGKNVASFTESLLSGKCAIGDVDLFPVSDFQAKIAAQVREYDPLDYFGRKNAAGLSRADQFGVIAAGEALKDSSALGYYSPYDIGVSLGAGAAGMLQAESWLRETLAGGKSRPALLRGVLPDRTATAISEIYNLGGYQGSITTACSSSATAIGWRLPFAVVPTLFPCLPLPDSILSGWLMWNPAPRSALAAGEFPWAKAQPFSSWRTRLKQRAGEQEFMDMCWAMPLPERLII